MASFPPLTGEQALMTGIPGNPPDLQQPALGLPVPSALPGGTQGAVPRSTCPRSAPSAAAGHRVACHFAVEPS